MASDPELTDAKVRELKKQAILDQVELLSNDLGNPERYFPQLRSAGLLDRFDCETIRHQVTGREKVVKFVDIITEGRGGEDATPPFDLFVDILNQEGVHTSVARGLQRALARAKQRAVREISMKGKGLEGGRGGARVEGGRKGEGREREGRGRVVRRWEERGGGSEGREGGGGSNTKPLG